MIPYTQHNINNEDIRAVSWALKGKIITRGEIVEEFEQAIADYVGAKYAVAFNSGTSALNASCHIVFPARVVATTPLTFASTAGAICQAGGTPKYVDIDESLCMSNLGDYGAALPVHFAGYPMDLSGSDKLVVEDGAHALGATGVGSCENSEITCFSFHPAKLITTGEGGVAVTNHEELYHRLRDRRDPRGGEPNPRFPVYGMYQNYYMTDFQAALGLSQLKRIDHFLKRRKEIAGEYNYHFSKIEQLKLPPAHPGHAWHIYVLRTKNRGVKRIRLREKGIETQIHYEPLRHMKNAIKYYEEAFTIPLYPALDERLVIKAIKEVWDD